MCIARVVPSIYQAAVRQGLAMRPPCRFEVREVEVGVDAPQAVAAPRGVPGGGEKKTGITVVLDAAHNPPAIASFFRKVCVYVYVCVFVVVVSFSFFLLIFWSFFSFFFSAFILFFLLFFLFFVFLFINNSFCFEKVLNENELTSPPPPPRPPRPVGRDTI